MSPQIDISGADSKLSCDKIAGQSGSVITVQSGHNLAGSGSGLTALPAANLTGSLPSIDGSNLTGLASGYTELGVANTTSGSSSTIGSIPAAVKTILIVFNQVSTTGAGEFNLQLGDSGGLETSGYLSNAHKMRAASTDQIGYHDTAHFGIAQGGGAADPIMTVMHLTRNAAGQHTWVLTWNAYVSSEYAACYGVGRKSLSGELTQISMITNGTFDSGTWNAYYQ